MTETKYDVWDLADRFALVVILAAILILNVNIAAELEVITDGVEEYAMLSVYGLGAYALLPAAEIIWSSSVPIVKRAYRRATA